MANQMTHLPHIENITSGYQKYDPVHKSIFQVDIHLPVSLTANYKIEEALLTEQVTAVSGLEALQKMPTAGSQKFRGIDVSFLNPVLDNSYADITITFNLNLKNVTDNFVLRAFKAWGALSYDIQTGARTLKSEYCATGMTIAEANRDGAIWRAYSFKDVMITQIQGLGDLDYTSNDAQTIQVTFRSDYWHEILGVGDEINTTDLK